MLKKVVITLIICSSLFVSSYGYANPFLTSLFSFGGKALDLGLKIPPVMNSLEQMKERRNAQEYAGQLQYNRGAVSLNPNVISYYAQGETLRNQAWVEFAAKDLHKQAIPIYEKALEKDANNSKTWHGYGWSLSESGQYARATNAFSIAIYLGNYSKKKESESWRYLGWNYQRQDYIKEAQYCYRIAVMLDPKNNRAHDALSEITKLMMQTAKQHQTHTIQNALSNTQSTPPITKGIYTLQAGVFQSETNAAQLLKKLKATNQNLQISRRQTTNGLRYHVEIGSFSNRSLANQAKTAMLKLNPDQKFFIKHYE